MDNNQVTELFFCSSNAKRNTIKTTAKTDPWSIDNKSIEKYTERKSHM